MRVLLLGALALFVSADNTNPNDAALACNSIQVEINRLNNGEYAPDNDLDIVGQYEKIQVMGSVDSWARRDGTGYIYWNRHSKVWNLIAGCLNPDINGAGQEIDHTVSTAGGGTTRQNGQVHNLECSGMTAPLCQHYLITPPGKCSNNANTGTCENTFANSDDQRPPYQVGTDSEIDGAGWIFVTYLGMPADVTLDVRMTCSTPAPSFSPTVPPTNMPTSQPTDHCTTGTNRVGAEKYSDRMGAACKGMMQQYSCVTYIKLMGCAKLCCEVNWVALHPELQTDAPSTSAPTTDNRRLLGY